MKKKIIVSTLFLTIMGSSQAISWADIATKTGTYLDYASKAASSAYETVLGETWKKVAIGTVATWLLATRILQNAARDKIKNALPDKLDDRRMLFSDRLKKVASEFGSNPTLKANGPDDATVYVTNKNGKTITLFGFTKKTVDQALEEIVNYDAPKALIKNPKARYSSAAIKNLIDSAFDVKIREMINFYAKNTKEAQDALTAAVSIFKSANQ